MLRLRKRFIRQDESPMTKILLKRIDQAITKLEYIINEYDRPAFVCILDRLYDEQEKIEKREERRMRRHNRSPTMQLS